MLHTHDLGSQGQRIKLLPQAPPGPADVHGRTVSHKLLCVGSWNDEVESHLMSFVNLSVTSRAQEVLATDQTVLGSWESPGKITDIQVADLGSSVVLVVMATGRGSLITTRLTLPRTPGTTPNNIDIVDMPLRPSPDGLGDKRMRPQYVGLHRGVISSVDLQPDTRHLLTVGEDGGVCVVDMEVQGGAQGGEEDGPTVKPWKRSRAGCAAYTNGRWADTNTFATVDVFGSLQVWDVRAGPKPTATCPRGWGPAGAKALPLAGHSCSWWLHLHPSRPNLAATAGSGGEVAVWDLRLTSKPLEAQAPDGDVGDVWEVRFDPMQQSGPDATTSTPSLLFCTEGGTLGLASQAPRPQPLRTLPWGAASNTFQAPTAQVPASYQTTALHRGPNAVNSFDVGGPLGCDVVAVTDAQELVYIHRQ